MRDKKLKELIDSLVKTPQENECLEFKHNYHSAEEIGMRISALSNGACIQKQAYAYLVFGIENETHQITGSTFKATSHKKGNEDLEHWLSTRLNPRIDFSIYEFDYDSNRHISLFVIPATKSQPVEFLHISYIRVGSITRKLSEFPEKQAKIWKEQSIPFEKEIAKDNLSGQEVIKLLNTETYFDLLKIPYPSRQQGVLEKFTEEGLIIKSNAYAITKLGALLLAKNLRDFESVERKSVRIIVYKGKNKTETIREQTVVYGYAVGFIGMIDWINGQLPANEEIGKALRKETTMYPEIVIRELVANALIHQDLTEKGFPMIEIFSDRVEISNAGTPLVSPERFIDAYRSRNDKLADIMRRMRFCEEKGSGMDKVIFQNELYQLPPVNIIVAEQQTRVTVYSYKPLNDLSKKEKIRACYQHACLKYVSNEKMTNQTLRERFKIEDQNAAIASRIIRDALSEGVIKEEDAENKSRKYASYLPFWA
jgi:predicted HTH transcriptional regulator